MSTVAHGNQSTTSLITPWVPGGELYLKGSAGFHLIQYVCVYIYVNTNESPEIAYNGRQYFVYSQWVPRLG